MVLLEVISDQAEGTPQEQIPDVQLSMEELLNLNPAVRYRLGCVAVYFRAKHIVVFGPQRLQAWHQWWQSISSESV